LSRPRPDQRHCEERLVRRSSASEGGSDEAIHNRKDAHIPEIGRLTNGPHGSDRIGSALSFSANAESIRLKNYLHPENDRMRFFNEVYLAGAMDALTAYNVAAPVKLFCKDGLVSHEEAAQLLSDWAKQQTKMPDDTMIVIPMLFLLKKTYPCH
jgi:hypothetical protein